MGLLKQSVDQVSAPVSPVGRGLGMLNEKHSSLVLCPGALWCLQSLRPWGVFSLSCTLLCFPLLICRATLACYSSRPFFNSSSALFGGDFSGIYRLTIYRFLFVLLTWEQPFPDPAWMDFLTTHVWKQLYCVLNSSVLLWAGLTEPYQISSRCLLQHSDMVSTGCRCTRRCQQWQWQYK